MPLKLLKGIRHFKNTVLIKKQALLTTLSKGQSPDVLFITCSDSRVVPTLFTHSDLGVLFELRNAGNIVTPYSDQSSSDAATLEFGVVHLNINEIVVCGHSHCGAMKGVMACNLGDTLPCTESWLSQCKPLLSTLHERHTELLHNPELELKCLTQDNVLQQIEHLKSYPFIAERVAAGTLKLHAWYYEFEHGEVYIYNTEKNAFIPFEETVIEVALSYIQKTVEEETKAYLMNLVPHLDNEGINALCDKIERSCQKIVWDDLHRKITDRLAPQLSELFPPSQETLNPRLQHFINTHLLMHLNSLPIANESIEKTTEVPHAFLNCSTHNSYSLFSKTTNRVAPTEVTSQPSCCVIQ